MKKLLVPLKFEWGFRLATQFLIARVYLQWCTTTNDYEEYGVQTGGSGSCIASHPLHNWSWGIDLDVISMLNIFDNLLVF